MKTKFLGIDYGLKRTGLSITDTDKIFAFPFKTVDTSELIIQLKTLIEKENTPISSKAETKKPLEQVNISDLLALHKKS